MKSGLMCLILSTLFMVGCIPVVLMTIGAGIGTGGALYVNGELKSKSYRPLDYVWVSSQRTMERMEFNITKKEKDFIDAKLIAKGTNNKNIQIKLKRLEKDITEIKIRVGIFGDKQLSKIILEEILKGDLKSSGKV